MSLYQLFYQSRALLPFNLPELAQLLHQCRVNNSVYGITGVLLLTPDGRFLQVLEGEQSAVRALYRRIEADPRHYDCHIISEGPCDDGRCFAQWPMTFRPMPAAALRALLAPVLPPSSAALLLPRSRYQPELLAELQAFVAASAPVPGLEEALS